MGAGGQIQPEAEALALTYPAGLLVIGTSVGLLAIKLNPEGFDR
jgi:hypothetical protein